MNNALILQPYFTDDYAQMLELSKARHQAYADKWGFDERFLIYTCDDVDYSWRAMKAGFPATPLKTGIWHADYRDEERVHQYKKFAKQIDANNAYLREKHPDLYKAVKR